MPADPYTDFLQLLRDLNLIGALPVAEVESALDNAQEYDDPLLLLYSLPRVHYGFDSEYFWNPTVGDSYKRMVREISAISRGMFLPTNLATDPAPQVEHAEMKSLTLSFDFAGRTYSRELIMEGDSVDMRFVDTINAALTDAGSEGRCYWMDSRDQMVIIFFLTRAQYAALKEYGISDLRQWQDIYILPGDSEPFV